jgi:radical SAM-linked protein
MHIAVSDETILLVVKFRIEGSSRFLSHAETLRVLQRACVRAGIELQYTQGFNPHPKMSLPLPRSVGVESDDELLCLRVDGSTGAQEHKSTSELCDSIKTNLSQQLPEGFELLSVTNPQADAVFYPRLVTYILPVRDEYIGQQLKERAKQLLASESLNVTRQLDAKGLKSKNIDVRDFLKSIVINDSCIFVECKITPRGSIRVEEILKLLSLDMEKLAVPIRRTSVQWQETDDGGQMAEDRRRRTDDGRQMTEDGRGTND